MSIKKILNTPNKLLETPCTKAGEINEESMTIVNDLVDTLLNATNPEGAGLAAPQIGVLKRIFVARDFYEDPTNTNKLLSKTYVFINPKIISKSKNTQTILEGCLSIPDTYGYVKRPKKIKIKATNEEGKKIRMTISGYLAQVFQHEMDHIDGILFTSKISGKMYTEKETLNLDAHKY